MKLVALMLAVALGGCAAPLRQVRVMLAPTVPAAARQCENAPRAPAPLPKVRTVAQLAAYMDDLQADDRRVRGILAECRHNLETLDRALAP